MANASDHPQPKRNHPGGTPGGTPAPHRGGHNPAAATLRYAHPFYQVKPARERPSDRALTWSRNLVGTIPPPRRDNPTATMTLADVIGAPGAAAIQSTGMIRFHTVGDTGKPGGPTQQQEEVSDDMTLDFQPDADGTNPAFFLHLGDVIYGHMKDEAYRDEFYRAYMHYPGKIIAIAGNHDGEVIGSTDPETLQAFLANFCAPTSGVPDIAKQVGIFREMVAQPGVYWRLNAPFVNIIGLYSNVLEGPGALKGPSDDTSQIDWLVATLQTIQREGERKALIIATHHPPFSKGGHSGSADMLADIDRACERAGLTYDALLSGHSHNYQRYTRRHSFQGQPRETPFVVAGMGGHGMQKPDDAFGQPSGDHTFDSSLGDYGYLLVTVSARQLTIEMWQVPSGSNKPFDRVMVDLAAHQLV